MERTSRNKAFEQRANLQNGKKHTKMILPRQKDPKHLHFLAEKKRWEHIHKNDV